MRLRFLWMSRGYLKHGVKRAERFYRRKETWNNMSPEMQDLMYELDPPDHDEFLAASRARGIVPFK